MNRRHKAEDAAAQAWGAAIARRKQLEGALANPDAAAVKETLPGETRSLVPKTIIWGRELAGAIDAEEDAYAEFLRSRE